MWGHGTVSTLTSKTTTGARPLRVRLTGVVGWVLLTCGAGVFLAALDVHVLPAAVFPWIDRQVLAKHMLG